MPDGNFDARLTIVWKICYGGYETRAMECVGRSLSYLSVGDLRSRIQTIDEALGPIAPLAITCEKLHALCFLLDPDLEGLLSPFSTLSPFMAPSQEAKEALGAYIAEKLGNS